MPYATLINNQLFFSMWLRRQLGVPEGEEDGGGDDEDVGENEISTRAMNISSSRQHYLQCQFVQLILTIYTTPVSIETTILPCLIVQSSNQFI